MQACSGVLTVASSIMSAAEVLLSVRAEEWSTLDRTAALLGNEYDERREDEQDGGENAMEHDSGAIKRQPPSSAWKLDADTDPSAQQTLSSASIFKLSHPSDLIMASALDPTTAAAVVERSRGSRKNKKHMA